MATWHTGFVKTWGPYHCSNPDTMLLGTQVKLFTEMEEEGMKLEGQRLWVVQWICVTWKLWTGNYKKCRKEEGDGGKVKVVWVKKQDMKDTPLSLPLLPWRWRQYTALTSKSHKTVDLTFTTSKLQKLWDITDNWRVKHFTNMVQE
jgi:hypothetical protein